MTAKYPIDSGWFHQTLRGKQKTVRDLALFMDVHFTAVSKMLNGQRKMTADEQDQIAQFFGVGIVTIAAHRRGVSAGFAEAKQDEYEAYAPPVAPTVEPATKMVTAADIIHKDGKRWFEAPDGGLLELHPAYGCMKGTMTIPDDLDLTAPADPDWGKVYEDG